MLKVNFWEILISLSSLVTAFIMFNPLRVNVLFLYPLKTPETQRIFDV